MIPAAEIGEVALTIHAPEEILFEPNREGDACDVIVRMDDGTVYTTTFVTLDYLRRQMDLSFQLTEQIDDTPAVRYAAIDTMHIVVEALIRDTIEDTIDNLIALDVFESYFVRVTESTANDDLRTMNDGKLATQEVAAVVISDVLVVQR